MTPSECLSMIEAQTGLRLSRSAEYPGVRRRQGAAYMIVDIADPCYLSPELAILERFASQYGQIRVEPTGVRRVAIFADLVSRAARVKQEQ